VENSPRISKLNSTSYAYLGCADTHVHSNDEKTKKNVSRNVLSNSKISRPIAGEVKQEHWLLSNITGKPPQITPYPNQSFTLENLLPPVQQAPKNSSGEFHIKYQIPNKNCKYQIFTSNVKQTHIKSIMTIYNQTQSYPRLVSPSSGNNFSDGDHRTKSSKPKIRAFPRSCQPQHEAVTRSQQ
jgi:hypothetical protein